jgi:hypothetical protein
MSAGLPILKENLELFENPEAPWMANSRLGDSPCARSQAGRGRVLRADIAGAAAAYSTKTENDLHARRTSLFFCLLLHLNQQYWLLLSEVVLPMKPCQE